MNTEPKNWSLLTGAAPDKSARTASEFVDAQVALVAPRHMMIRLRDIMNGAQTADEKLTAVINLIARELRADVCTCFIQRAGDLLELYASYGLAPDLARRARLRVGEGLIGDIAANPMPAIHPDILSHPSYVERPETGNGDYRGFCGVPVLRGGRVRGVLVIQNRLPRNYGPEVVEILQTVAMVLAELVVAGRIVTRREINAGYASGKKPNQVQGHSMGRGLAIGTVVLYEPGITMQQIISDDPAAEKKHLHEALASMQAAIEKMLARNARLNGNGESRDILEAYQMFARDRGWLARIEAAIEKGLSAEAAVATVQNETRARMMQVTDVYIRERLQDLEDLSVRLMSHLMKDQRGRGEEKPLPDDIVLVARSLGPAALLDYDHAKLRGVILEKGSQSNHVAIVARALGIPIVGQCGDVLNFVADGDTAIVDGDHGMAYIRPSDYVVDLYTKNIETRQKRTALYRRYAPQQTVTKDGKHVHVMMNAGLMVEVDMAQTAGAEGIGLFRSELSFMAWQKYPLVVTQAELYGKIMDKMAGKPVTFRTLDVGGDKPLPYFRAPEEDNPALGWRAIRIGMDRPALLRTQFRALIRGARGRNLRIMLPFVSEVSELDRARDLLEMEKHRARSTGQVLPEKIEIGVMIEVPALLFQLETLLASVDFVSVGTNDLMQYLFAADRGNADVKNRYDSLSPAMLRVLRDIAAKCRAAKVPVSVCGEMAAHPLEAMVLVALGFDTISMPAQSIEVVKMMIPTLDTEKLLPYLEQLMLSRAHSIREQLQSFARDHEINITQLV